MRPLMKSIGAVAAVTMLAVGISEVAAHHSAAMFDHSRTMTIKGSVVELRWVNPHVTLTVNGSLSSDDAPAEWLMEMTSPLRDPDRKGGALKQLTVLATGEVFSANIREQEKPGLE